MRVCESLNEDHRVRLLTFYTEMGREHEGRRLCRPGAVRRGEEPSVCRLQERHWRSPCLVAHRPPPSSRRRRARANESQVALIKEYRQKIEAELGKICEDILEVLEKHLIPSAQSGESKVFYHKM